MQYVADAKDLLRINDIMARARRARGMTMAAAERLATSYAKRIWDADKAYRRQAACEKLGFHRLADIFENRGIFIDYNSTDPKAKKSQQWKEDREVQLG